MASIPLFLGARHVLRIISSLIRTGMCNCAFKPSLVNSVQRCELSSETSLRNTE